MNKRAEVLEKFIRDDYGIVGSGRWKRSVKHNSLVLDTQKGVFFFNTKNIAGGPFEYLRFVRGLPEDSARTLITSLGGKILDGEISVYEDSSVIPYTKLVKSMWENGKNNREYWYKRLLTDDTIDRFQLGYFHEWYTIPVFENGELVQIQKRKDNPKSIFPWYKGIYPKIFNADILAFTDTVVLAEGIVDSILLNQYGVPSVSKTIGAKGWHNSWFKLFMKQKLIYIVYDNDLAGVTGAIKMAKHLGLNRCKLYTFDGYSEGYDIVDWFRDYNTLEDLMYKIRKESLYGFQLAQPQKINYQTVCV